MSTDCGVLEYTIIWKPRSMVLKIWKRKEIGRGGHFKQVGRVESFKFLMSRNGIFLSLRVSRN